MCGEEDDDDGGEDGGHGLLPPVPRAQPVVRPVQAGKWAFCTVYYKL